MYWLYGEYLDRLKERRGSVCVCECVREREKVESEHIERRGSVCE